MVRRLQTSSESLYGLPQPVQNVFPVPIIGRRSPAASDTGYVLGQIWVNKLAGTVFTLSSNSGGVATWLSVGGSFTPVVASLTATDIITATAATSTKLNGNEWSAIGTDAAIDLTLTPKGAGIVTITSGDLDIDSGSLGILTAGNGIQIAEGANATMGLATLIGGTITVATTAVSATSRIFISRQTAGAVPGALGSLIIENVVAATSFDISAVAPADGTTPVITDVSEVNWLIVEPL